MKRILAISGGGMRGAIPARFLAELELRLQSPITGAFDMIAGTSTGSILAALCGRPDAPPASDMLKFYYESGPRIFPRRWLNLGLSAPKYDQSALERELRDCIGPARCSESRCRLLIPTTDADHIEAVFIKSWEEYWSEFPLWAAAASSSSAQTYFPAWSGRHRGRALRHLDGGNHTNNPAASALFEAYRLWPGEKLMLVHLGTGKQRNPKPLPDGGILRWAPLVFGTTSECQDDCARYFCTHAPGLNFFSFDVSMDAFPAMDDASTRTLDELVSQADRAIASEEEKWTECTNLLRTGGLKLLHESYDL